MADTKNTEATTAPEPAAPVQQKTTRGWAMPLISALVVVAALVVGGIGGFAIATATGAPGRAAIQQGPQGELPGGPGQGGQQGQRPDQGSGQQGPGQGQRPEHGPDQRGDDTRNDDTDSTDEGDSSEG